MAPLKASPSDIQHDSLSENTNAVSAPKSTFFLRRMKLSDTSILAEQSRQAYWLSPINNWLTPRAIDHPQQLTRQLCQAIRRRYCNASSLSLVAYSADNPDYPIGYAQFARLGEDLGARKWVSDKGIFVRLYLYMLSWLLWFYDKTDLLLFPDTISDPSAVTTFAAWIAEDTAKHWTAYPERQNRWYMSSVVVAPEYQGLGIGRMLVEKGLEEAKREGVPCGCSASPHGEHLYKKLGFTLLGDFCHRPEEEEDNAGGGIMCWFPEDWQGPRGE